MNNARLMTKDEYKKKVCYSMTNIKPSDEKIKIIEELRDSYKKCVVTLIDKSNRSREQSLAITKLEESLMWAIKGLILEDNNNGI